MTFTGEIMENVKLKKLGKYFTKGLQAGVLATAVIAGVACKQPTGGNNEKDEPIIVGPVNPDDKENGGSGNTQPETGYPAYYIDEEFAGQRFVPSDFRGWYFDEQDVKDQDFKQRYQEAKKFMDDKVAELGKMVAGQQGNPLYKEIDTALKQFNQQEKKGGITDYVGGYYKTLAPVFARMDQQVDDETFFRYDASYMKLAHYAYNNALGTANGSQLLKSNREMTNEPNNFFVKELANANFTYDEFTVNKAKAVMRDYLATVADATNTDVAVLHKVVDLALYNESMHGLRDLASNGNCTIKNGISRQRTNAIFYGDIAAARDRLNAAENTDDRTM